jgi:hypothetical protein
MSKTKQFCFMRKSKYLVPRIVIGSILFQSSSVHFAQSGRAKYEKSKLRISFNLPGLSNIANASATIPIMEVGS